MVALPETLTAACTPAVPIDLVTAPPGTGKTYSVLTALADDGPRAVYTVPTHELAIQIQADLEALGVRTHRWRRGPDDEDECPHRDLVAFFRTMGYMIRRGPCADCVQRRSCAYRSVFTCSANRTAQVLILTSWHLRRPDLWSLKALEERPLVVVDEDALSALAAPVELTVERLRGFVENVQALRDAGSGGHDQAVQALADVFHRAAEDVLRCCATAGHGLWMPSLAVLERITDADRAVLADDDAFFSLVRLAYDAARRRTALPNVLADLRELASEPQPVHVSVGACRWTRKAAIPADRQVLMLDATAEPAVVEGVTGRAVSVIAAPLTQQRAMVFQVMDKVGTRAGNRQDLQREQSWTTRLAVEVARRHKGQSLLCITFKGDEDRLREILDREHGNATVVHYGALRGLNAFEDFQAGLILGRPMPNEAKLQVLAVAAFGREALDENLASPPLQWRLHTETIGPDTWEVRCQQYPDERWQAVWRHVVVGELMQAIGRLRPLTNDATIYVVTNEPLPETFELTAVYAGELFPSMLTSTRRTDFQQHVERYAEAMAELEASGQRPTNRAVCAKLGIRECNGFRYRNLVKEMSRVA